DFIEIIKDIPNEIFTDKRLQRLIEIAANNASLVNDVHSSSKDREEGIPNGFISVVEQEKNLDEEGAMNYVCNYIEEEITEFNEIYQRIKADPDKRELINYADGLIDCMTGHI